jgi:DNA-binding XRE family transcriptional regulator
MVVSRQAFYAVEAETCVPGTVLGLKLALALDVQVEEIFSPRQDASLSGPIQRSLSRKPQCRLFSGHFLRD